MYCDICGTYSEKKTSCLSFRGNVLLVGAIGAHLASLARLALYMLDYHIHPVDCSYSNTFLDGLRSAVRQAGCDGKTTTVLFTVKSIIQCTTNTISMAYDSILSWG